jgi:hypothetical protein
LVGQNQPLESDSGFRLAGSEVQSSLPDQFFFGIIAAIRFLSHRENVAVDCSVHWGGFNEIVSQAPCFDNKMLFCANKLTMLLGTIVRGPPGNSRYKRLRRGGSLGS